MAPERSGPAIVVDEFAPAGIIIVIWLSWEPVRVDPPTTDVSIVGSVAVVVTGTVVIGTEDASTDVDEALGVVVGVVVIVVGEDPAEITTVVVEAGTAEVGSTVATIVTDVVGTTTVDDEPPEVCTMVADVP